VYLRERLIQTLSEKLKTRALEDDIKAKIFCEILADGVSKWDVERRLKVEVDEFQQFSFQNVSVYRFSGDWMPLLLPNVYAKYDSSNAIIERGIQGNSLQDEEYVPFVCTV
jgi:hypothetical protein